MTTSDQIRDDFLDGFGLTIGVPLNEAGEQWGAFSRQLSNADLRAIESGGFEAGEEQGEAFNQLYPTAEQP